MTVTTDYSALTKAEYTVHDLFDMPDDGRRYEVLDGALLVSPAPDSLHQIVGDIVSHLFRETAPPGVHSVTGVAVRLGEDTTTFIPDVVVTTVDPRTRRLWLEAHEVLAVVEIVSPNSKRRDRVLKPHVYAGVGIPCYWRVELDPGPRILVYVLDGDAYRLVDTLKSGTAGGTEYPFPVTLDPGEL